MSKSELNYLLLNIYCADQNIRYSSDNNRLSIKERKYELLHNINNTNFEKMIIY